MKRYIVRPSRRAAGRFIVVDLVKRNSFAMTEPLPEAQAKAVAAELERNWN